MYVTLKKDNALRKSIKFELLKTKVYNCKTWSLKEIDVFQINMLQTGTAYQLDKTNELVLEYMRTKSQFIAITRKQKLPLVMSSGPKTSAPISWRKLSMTENWEEDENDTGLMKSEMSGRKLTEFMIISREGRRWCICQWFLTLSNKHSKKQARSWYLLMLA